MAARCAHPESAPESPLPRAQPAASMLENSTTLQAPRPGPLKRLYNWVLSWADSRYGVPALFGLSFAESSFFPIPPDVLQVALSVGRPRRSLVYAAVSTLGSVLGGILGWWIGLAFWSSASGFFFEHVPGFTPESFALVEARYNEHAFLAIFTAAFTPIPFKVFTIASGAFAVPLGTLVVASILGRGARFFLVGGLIFYFGPAVRTWLDKYLGLATTLLVVVGVAGFVSLRFL